MFGRRRANASAARQEDPKATLMAAIAMLEGQGARPTAAQAAPRQARPEEGRPEVKVEVHPTLQPRTHSGGAGGKGSFPPSHDLTLV